jgi:hypothetical protein
MAEHWWLSGKNFSLVSQRSWVKVLAWRLVVVTDYFYGFPEFLQANSTVVPSVSPQWFSPSLSSFNNHQHCIIWARCTPRIFIFAGGTDSDATYNLCLIFRTIFKDCVMNTSVTYHCLQLHLYTYKYNCMFSDSVTQFKSQAFDLGVLNFIFYFILQNSSASVISWFWLQDKSHRTLKIYKCVVHTEWQNQIHCL